VDAFHPLIVGWDASGGCLILSFGSAVSLVISKSIELIGESCSHNHQTIESVSLESDSVLWEIGRGT
jgi:hypothetical protein